MKVFNKKLGMFLATSFICFNSYGSSLKTSDGYTIGMPIPPNNYNLKWNQTSHVSLEQPVCLVGYKLKGNYGGGSDHCKDGDDDYEDVNEDYNGRDDHYYECGDDNDDYYGGDYGGNANKSEVNVEIRAFGLNTQNSSLYQFTMRNDNNDFLKYSMEFYNPHNNSYKKLEQNKFVKGIRGAKSCENTTGQKIKVNVDLESLQGAQSGRYWDLVFLSSGKNSKAYALDLYYVYIDIEGGRIQVNQLDDINFGVYKIGQGDLSIEEQFCVHQSPASTYNISIYDTHPQSGEWKFNIDSGNTTIPYKVFFKTTSTGYYPVYNGSTMGSFISNEVVNCTNPERAGSAERAYIKIEISEKDLIKSAPELYKGTLYITASPE